MEYLEEIIHSSYFALFLILSIGILVGRIKIAGISLGLSAVIFVAIAFGLFGVQLPDILQQLGLLFFIYAVGIQAGPGFFSSFNKKGFSIIFVAIILVIIGALTTLVSIYLFDIPVDVAVGLYSGALTSTPGLAAAAESTKSSMASIGYGIAYPFGVVGVILFIHIIPKIIRVNIKKEEEKYKSEIMEENPELLSAHYIVENENVTNKTIEDLHIREMTQASISRVKHNGATIIPRADTQLVIGDVVRAVGTSDALQKMEILIGRKTDQEIQLGEESIVKWLLVSNKDVVNKSLAQLNLFNNYGATVVRIRRSGIDISPLKHVKIRFGDKVLVACQTNIEAVTAIFGNEDKKLLEIDFLPITLGLISGILLGNLSLPLPGGIAFKPGLTGGVLIAALVLSRIGKTGKIIWNISGSTNQMLRQLGLLLFLASVGTQAGENLVKTIETNGLQLFAVGAVITLLPMAVSVLIGHYFLKINFLKLLGTITGGMTSTPGLSAIEAISDSDASNIAYATVYPVALVTVILCNNFLGALM